MPQFLLTERAEVISNKSRNLTEFIRQETYLARKDFNHKLG